MDSNYSAVVVAIIAAIAAIVAAIVTFKVNERNLELKNITEERVKWRIKVREITDNLINEALNEKRDVMKIRRLCCQLAINLNPFDDNDRELIKAAEDLGKISDELGKISDESDMKTIKKFSEHVQLLLKHDWDRAKEEVRPWFNPGKDFVRVPYTEYKEYEESFSQKFKYVGNGYSKYVIDKKYKECGKKYLISFYKFILSCAIIFIHSVFMFFVVNYFFVYNDGNFFNELSNYPIFLVFFLVFCLGWFIYSCVCFWNYYSYYLDDLILWIDKKL